MSAPVTQSVLDTAIELRRNLHAHPELSGKEKQTAGRIRSFLENQAPSYIIDGLGGYGVAAIYDSGVPGPVVLLRADLDALPIEEINDIPHRSTVSGVSHKCGHDGHMAILAGLSMILNKQKPQKGRIVLLFQPEEENGQGAAKVIQDNGFRSIRPDYAFALHNLPGYNKNTIVLKDGPFAAASKGMIASLRGKSSHAAHPEQGNSPVHMMIELMKEWMAIPQTNERFTDFTLLTIIHARLGEVAFGTNPGKGVVMSTLRTFLNEDMDILNSEAVNAMKRLARDYSITTDMEYTEEFPATINHTEATAIVRNAIRMVRVSKQSITEPFRWSEDFGHFTGLCKGALFGLGSGKDHPSLHNHDYDFPDEIMGTGIEMFYHIADQLVNLR